MAGENFIDWVGLIAILASLPPIWFARRFWNSPEPARLLMSRVLMGEGVGFLFGGLVVIVTAQWEWAVAVLMLSALTGAGFGFVAMQRAIGRGNAE
jgi:hypothetical protein